MILSLHLAEIAKAMPAGQAKVAEELLLLSRLAHSIETELEVHRMRERQRIAEAAMDTAATETLAELIIDPAGVVVRPEFGRKS